MRTSAAAKSMAPKTSMRGGGRQRHLEHLPARPVGGHRRDQDVEDTAAGQPDGERVLVAVAEPFAHHLAVLERLGAQVVDSAFHTASGDRPDGHALGVHSERGARPARRAAADAHDRGDSEGPSLVEPQVQFVRDVQHGVSFWWWSERGVVDEGRYAGVVLSRSNWPVW